MSIASLPVELISKICNHLGPQQWVALRLSCRALYENSLENFAETYYKNIRFIVTSQSLHDLEELSKSNGLREHVQELWMIPTVFSGTEEPIGMVSISSKSCQPVKGDELNTRHAVHKAMIADNSNLLLSETFSVRLRECMGRFQNLHTIGMAHYSTEFLLDPRQQTVSFLGRRQMMSQLDFRFDVYSLKSLTHTNKNSQIRKLNSLALSKLLLALCGSSCKPRKLYTCDSNFCGDIGPKIAISEEQSDYVLSALNSLEDLHLCIDLTEAAWLKLITNLAPQLERLTLSQDHMSGYPAKSYVGNMLHGINFTRLRVLHIHELDIYFNSLKSLLLSVKKNLVILTLERVTLRSEELRAAQHRESPNYQENQSSTPLIPTYTPNGPGFVPTSPGLHPTSPSYGPTPPSFVPILPSYTPAPPAAEPELPESAPPPPQHSSISESSEPMTNEYLIANWSSTYHPHSSPEFAGSVCPTLETLMAWERNEQKVTCVSSLLDTLQNELSLEILSLEDIICDGNYYYFKRVNDGIEKSGRVDFDIRSAGILLREWISDLRPEASCPGYRILGLKAHKEMEDWFDKMIGKDSGPFNRSSRRRNGKPASCEPCRRDKVRCDHKLPVCTRCKQRRIANTCFYHPAPLTRARPSLPSPLTDSSLGPSRIAGTSPGDAELQPYQSPETSFPLRMGYLGPTSVVAEFLSVSESAGELGDDSSARVESSRHLPPYWFKKVLNVLALLEDFSIIEVLARELNEMSQAAMIPSPFVGNAFKPIRKLADEYLLKRRSDIQVQRLASKIVENTARSFHIPSSTEGCDFHQLYTGDNTRLEILGIIFSLAGRSTYFGLGSGLFLSHDEPRSRAQFAQKMFLASDITLQLCKMLTPNNDLLVWLLYENMLLSSMIHGDSSEVKWHRLGDLSTNIFTLGAHREVKPSSGLPRFIIETRKRLFASSYRLDKNIATSLDRPPRLSFRHSDCGLPLAISDDVYGASSEAFDQACENLDQDGWNLKAVYQTSDWIRARYITATFREEILEVAVRTPSPEAAAQLNDISRRCKDKWESYPAHLRLVPHVWNDDAPVAVSLMLITAYLAYLDNDLIIQKLLVGKYQAPNVELLSVSSEILSTVLFLGTQRDHMRHIHRDLVWVIILYGFPAVSVLTRALQSEARHGTKFEYSGSRAELIRNLSVFISHIESMERPGNGNYVLFSRASKMFSGMIDEILEARLKVDQDDGPNKTNNNNIETPVLNSVLDENENFMNLMGNESLLESVDFRMMFDQWLV